MKRVRQQGASFRLTIGGMRTLAVALVATVLAACGSDSPSGPGTATSPEGNYTISTINGKAVPMAIFSDTGGYKLEVLAGTLGMQSGGKYSVITSYRQTIAGIVSTYSDSSGSHRIGNSSQRDPLPPDLIVVGECGSEASLAVTP